MNYKTLSNFELKIGSRLVGWPFLPILNPGNISSVDKLRILLSTLSDGTCHWENIPADELDKLREEQAQKMRQGLVAVRKQRSDIGVSRKPAESKKRSAPKPSARSTSSGSKKTAAKRRKITSTQFVESSEDDDDESEEDENEKDPENENEEDDEDDE